jgi:transposase
MTELEFNKLLSIDVDNLPDDYKILKDTLKLALKAIVFLINENQQLKNEIQHLKGQLAKDSHNSSKPPSTDGFKKTIKPSIPKSEGRKPGGQLGHQGKTLKLVENPDKIIKHEVHTCAECGKELSLVKAENIEKHQIFELPVIKLEVIEHQVEKKLCPNCGSINKSAFPYEATNIVQYGSNLQSHIVYLNNYQLIPIKRCTEFVEDVFGNSISGGSVERSNKVCFEHLEEHDEKVKTQLLEEELVHFDETGMYVDKKREWLHVASTDNLTHYEHHEKRGKKAMDEIGILPRFNNIAMHDGYQSYPSYECKHSLCNAHHLRELTFIEEQEKAKWSKVMKKFLLHVKNQIEKTKQEGLEKFSDDLILKYEKRYDKILELGLKLEPKTQQIDRKTKGRKKQSKSKNMLDRLIANKGATLMFMKNFHVPFDNNLAERDLRMMKVKQKISGCFRGKGSDYFCRIRGYISTLKKNKQPVLENINKIFYKQIYFPLLT